jgi:hypothetical protein
MAAKPKAKAARMDRAAPIADFGENEDAEYFDIVSGVLRHPVPCVDCAKPTRLPFYAGGDKARCMDCYRLSEGWPVFPRQTEPAD